MTNENSADPTTTAHMGFFPMVSGDQITVTQAGAGVVMARGDLALTQGGIQMARVHGDTTIHQGGVQTMLARGDVSIREGGVLLGAARSVRVENGLVGVAIGRDVDLTNSRVLLTQQNALAMGAVAGLVFALLSRVFRR